MKRSVKPQAKPRAKHKPDLKPHCITITPKGSVVYFGDHQQYWKGYRFERRSSLRRMADKMRASRGF